MSLAEITPENMIYMVDKIIEKLKMLNADAIKSSQFDEKMYDELKEIYEIVMEKKSFSPSEMQAIVEELGKLRKEK